MGADGVEVSVTYAQRQRTEVKALRIINKTMSKKPREDEKQESSPSSPSTSTSGKLKRQRPDEVF
jgi:hypothetical protein